MAKLLSVALNKAIRRDSGGTEPLYHEYDSEVDKTYLEGGSDERFGFATTRDVKTTPHARRNRDINQNGVLEDELIEGEPIIEDEPFDDELIVDEHIEDEPFDFQRDIVENIFPDFNA
jgi:hypothetical protein